MGMGGSHCLNVQAGAQQDLSLQVWRPPRLALLSPCPALAQAAPLGDLIWAAHLDPQSVQNKGHWTGVPSSRTQWVGGGCAQYYLGIPFSI